MQMTTVQIILNTNHRRNAAKALGLVPGSDEFKAFTGPTFVAPNNYGLEEGMYCVRPYSRDESVAYYYPLHTISRVKVTSK